MNDNEYEENKKACIALFDLLDTIESKGPDAMKYFNDVFRYIHKGCTCHHYQKEIEDDRM